MKTSLDEYTLRARVAPALIVALPVALTVLTFLPSGIGLLWSVFAEAGVAMLLATVARKVGKDKQMKLFAKWGGRPSERLLSHGSCRNQVMLHRRHDQLRQHLPGVRIPTEAEELADPDAANQVYEACIDFLRGRTRKREQFTLVFEENCNYGFSRNVWGMKGLGVGLAILAVITMGGRLYGQVSSHQSITVFSVVLFFVATALLILWALIIRPDWVRTSADAYADALVAALDNL